MKWKFKERKGITLIALVVTIIVLIILASVSINLVLGSDGIITRAKNAKTQTLVAQVKDEVGLKILDKQIANNGEITKAQLKEILEQYFNDVPETLPEDLTTLTLTTKEAYGSTSINISDIVDVTTTTETNKTLVSQITGTDYGKTINYSVSVTNRNGGKTTLNNWKVFLNDGNNVYIILDDYLPVELVPESSLWPNGGLDASYYDDATSYGPDVTMEVCGNDSDSSLVDSLLNNDYWSEFSSGYLGSTAIGSPTLSQLVASYNKKYYESKQIEEGKRYNGSELFLKDDELYLPNTVGDVDGYWLASGTFDEEEEQYYIWGISASGYIGDNFVPSDSRKNIRPVICLPKSATGTVGTTVSIDF